MNYQPGTYLIIKPTHWIKSGASILIIECVDTNNELIVYRYSDDENNKYRERDVYDFSDIEIVPITSLTAVLI
jgi:hypothetical protein